MIRQIRKFLKKAFTDKKAAKAAEEAARIYFYTPFDQ